MTPLSKFPFSIIIFSLSTEEVVEIFIDFGIIVENNCFPDHNNFGFNIYNNVFEKEITVNSINDNVNSKELLISKEFQL